ncbi:MAG: extracellular solute-binding protein [Clostridiales bacterium]|nr:extracellular solute-binding protein [Clostridiales bacterium]
MKAKNWKILPILLLAAAALSGCASGTQGDATEAEVSSGGLSMAWWGNQVRNERTQQVLDQYAEETGMTVSGQFFQWDDYWSKLATSAAGKKLPDVIQMDMSYLQQYVDKGQLLDLTPYFEDGTIDRSNLSDETLNMGKVGDGIYGIASGTSASCLFYNKTLLDENGITIKDNMTLDEFIEISREIYEKTGYRANLIHYGLYMEPYTRARDIQTTDHLGGASAEDYVDYFKISEEGVKEGWHISPMQAADTASAEEDPMVYGSNPDNMTWCTVNGSAMITAYQSAAAEGVDIAITTIPTDDPKKSNYVKPGMYFSVTSDTANPEEAAKLVNYLVNSPDAAQILLAERGIPASTAIAEEIMPLLSPEEQENAAFIMDVITPNCSDLPPFPVEGNSEAQDLLRKLEEKVKYGEYTAEQAAEEYFTGANGIYQQHQQ